ncbi:hypothetical protein LUZ60_014887 [Juncus effusus]|nr:hypothetical protein LUZ60_014887 [Juncus effusus]
MAETKRRLPNWMLKQHTETKSRDSDSNTKLEEKSDDQNEIKPSKPKRGRKPTKLDEENIGESELVLQKCTNRTNRVKRKNKAEIGKDDGKRSSKKKLKGDEIDEFSPKFSDDGEIDLTVDDLVSIAEEYVNVDEEKQRNQTSTSTTITENNTTKNRSKSIEASLLNPNLNFEITDQNDNHENIAQTNIVKTGDAAQDMLDLFLGPLLKNPGLNKEPSFESVEPACSTSLFERSERETYRGEKVDEPLEKKKSSLKDKVALFLD